LIYNSKKKYATLS